MRCLSDLEPSRGRVFHWEYWHAYMLKKFVAKVPGGEKDFIAMLLSEKIREDYISYKLRNELEALREVA